jgi:hypothetical protein
MNEPKGSEILDELFAEDKALTKLKEDLAELDSEIFRFSKTHDLRGPAARSLDLMRQRRASIELKIATYEV